MKVQELMQTEEFNDVIIPKLRGYSYKLTQERESANDLFQETMMKALDGSEHYKDDNFNAWLHTIMFNAFVNTYRRGQRYIVLNERDLYEQDRANSSLDCHLINQKMYAVNDGISNLTCEEIEGHLNGLSWRVRDVYKDYITTGLIYEDLAVIHNKPCGTIKSNVHRASTRMKALLTPLYNTDNRYRRTFKDTYNQKLKARNESKKTSA